MAVKQTSDPTQCQRADNYFDQAQDFDVLHELTLFDNYSTHVKKILDTFFPHDADVREQLQEYIFSCALDVNDSPKVKEVELHQKYGQQITELLDLLNDPEIAPELKRLAVAQLPAHSSPKFLIASCEESLAILRCRDLDKGKLVNEVYRMAEKRGETVFQTEVLGRSARSKPTEASRADACALLTDKEKRQQEWFIQGRNNPLYMVGLYSSHLIGSIKSLTSESDAKLFDKFSADLQLAIGDAQYKALSDEAKAQGKELNDYVSSMSQRKLSLLVAQHLFSAGAPIQSIATKDHTMIGLDEHEVIVHDAQGYSRRADFSDLLTIDLPRLDPLLRSEVIYACSDRAPKRGDLAELIVHYELGKEGFDDSELYKYDFKRHCLAHFKAKKSAGDDSFKLWLEQHTDYQLQNMIFPFLHQAEDKQAFCAKLDNSDFSFSRRPGYIPADFCNILGQDYLKYCPRGLKKATLERLCQTLLDERGKRGAREAQLAIDLLLPLMKQTDCIAAVYTAAQSGNSEALQVLHQHLQGITGYEEGTPREYSGKDPALVAAEYGHPEALKVILGHVGRDLIKYEQQKDGALFVAAARHRDTACLRYLISQQGDDLVQLVSGQTSPFLRRLTKQASPEAIRFLKNDVAPFNILHQVRPNMSREWNDCIHKRFVGTSSASRELVNELTQIKGKSDHSITPAYPEKYQTMSADQLLSLTRRERSLCLLHCLKAGNQDQILALFSAHQAKTILDDIDQSDLFEIILMARGDRLEMLKLLQNHGYDPVSEDCAALKLALQPKYKAAVVARHIALEYKAKGKASHLDRVTTHDGQNIMHLAVALNNPELIFTLNEINLDFILAKTRAKKSVDDYEGDTPLLTYLKMDNDKDGKILQVLIRISDAVMYYPAATVKGEDDAFLTAVKKNNVLAAQLFINDYQKWQHNPSSLSQSAVDSYNRARNYLLAHCREARYKNMCVAFGLEPKGS